MVESYRMEGNKHTVTPTLTMGSGLSDRSRIDNTFVDKVKGGYGKRP